MYCFFIFMSMNFVISKVSSLLLPKVKSFFVYIFYYIIFFFCVVKYVNKLCLWTRWETPMPSIKIQIILESASRPFIHNECYPNYGFYICIHAYFSRFDNSNFPTTFHLQYFPKKRNLRQYIALYRPNFECLYRKSQ